MSFSFQHIDFYIIIPTIIAGVLHLLLNTVRRRLERSAGSGSGLWGRAVLDSLFLPLSLAIWLSAAITTMRLLETAPSIWLEHTQEILILGISVWLFIRLVSSVQRQLLRKDAVPRFEPTVVNLAARVLQAAAGVVGVLLGMQMLGYSVSVLLTFGGIGGLAVGLAARDMLANFLAGILIYLDPPFKEGDFISCRGTDVEGEVVKTSWRTTEVRSYERGLLHVPNTVLADNVVENISSIDHRRIRESIGLRYVDASLLPQVLKDIQALLAQHPGICREKPHLVVFERFGASSLDILVNAYAATNAWSKHLEIKEDILLKIYEVVTAHGADIAFPTRTLDFPPRPEEH